MENRKRYKKWLDGDSFEKIPRSTAYRHNSKTEFIVNDGAHASSEYHPEQANPYHPLNGEHNDMDSQEEQVIFRGYEFFFILMDIFLF